MMLVEASDFRSISGIRRCRSDMSAVRLARKQAHLPGKCRMNNYRHRNQCAPNDIAISLRTKNVWPLPMTGIERVGTPAFLRKPGIDRKSSFRSLARTGSDKYSSAKRATSRPAPASQSHFVLRESSGRRVPPSRGLAAVSLRLIRGQS